MNYLRLPTRAAGYVRDALAYAGAMLRDPITPQSAKAAIARRFAVRPDAFLDSVRRAIFEYPASPYRGLLAAVGVNFPRLERLVRMRGVELALAELAAAGAYVTIQEFKGLQEIRRGDHTFRVTPEAFNNPLVRRGLTASSGGTRSAGIPTTISSSNHRMGAEHLAVALDAYGLWPHPVVVMLPSAHGASLWAVLALAAMGKTPPRWFSQFPGGFGSVSALRAFLLTIRGYAAMLGRPLPAPEHVPFGREERVTRWLTSAQASRGCGIFTTPSSALRVALAARVAGVSLSHVTFITVAEPLTPMKLAGIQHVGARAFSSLGFTEFGRVTYGCARPAGPDDTHVCADGVAVLHRRRPVDQLGTEVDALLFTTLMPDARKILLNVETGDYAALARRSCGCALEGVGWTDHLEEIRSFEKLNAEGRLFYGSQLIALVEEILPTQFGGDATDYQLLEQEDEQGFTRLSVLVHPRLGALDSDAVLACVEQSLRGVQARATDVWHETGTVRVLREPPMLTKAGKLMALHHLGPAQSSRFELDLLQPH